MFLELLVVRDFQDTSTLQISDHTGVTKAIDLFNKYFAKTVVTQDPSLAAMAAVLHCIRIVQLAHSIETAGSASMPRQSHSSRSLPSLGEVARNPMLFLDTLLFLQSYDVSFSRCDE